MNPTALDDTDKNTNASGSSPVTPSKPYVSLVMGKESHDLWGSPRESTLADDSLQSSLCDHNWSIAASPEMPVLDQGPPLEISVIDGLESDDDVSVLNDNPDEDDHEVLPQPTYDVLQTLFQDMDRRHPRSRRRWRDLKHKSQPPSRILREPQSTANCIAVKSLGSHDASSHH